MNLRTIFGGLTAVMFCLALLSSMPRADEHMDHQAMDHKTMGGHADKAADHKNAAAAPMDMAYPLDFCVVTGDKLPASPVIYSHAGREIRFCCSDCIAKFEAQADDYLAKIDAAIIAQQMDSYPINKCMITDEELGGMGEPVDIVVNNRLVRLCCGGCEDAIRAEPEKYIAMLDKAAIEAQLKSYPLKTCPITDEELGPLAVNAVYGGKLVRFCCEHCVADFLKDPATYMAKIYGK